MTTKDNFVFSLQQFADKDLKVEVNGGKFVVSGYSGTYEGKVGTEPDTQTVTYSGTYIFSATNGVYSIDTVSAYTTNTGVVGVNGSDTLAVTAEGVSISGNDYTSGTELYFAGLGSIKAFDSGDTLKLTASGKNAADLVSLEGSIALSGHIQETVNGVALDFGVGTGNSGYVTISSADNGVILDASDTSDVEINLNKLDTLQTWVLDTGDKVQVGTKKTTFAMAGNASLTGNSTDYFDFTGLAVGSGMTITNLADKASLSVNDIVIIGNVGSVTVQADKEIAAYGSTAKSSSISAASSLGSWAEVGAGKGVVITAEDGITSIGGFASNGHWALGSKLQHVTLDSVAYDFSAANATISADKSSVVSSLALKEGTVAISNANSVNATTPAVSIVGGAAWKVSLGKYDADSLAVLTLDTLGAATVTGTGDAIVTLRGGDGYLYTENDTLQLAAAGKNANGGAATIQSGAVVAVDSLVGGTDWLTKSPTVTFGNQIWEFDDTSGATLSANTKGNAASLAAFSNVVTLTSSDGISGLTIGDKAWTVSSGYVGKYVFTDDGNLKISDSANVLGVADAVLDVSKAAAVTVNGVAINASTLVSGAEQAKYTLEDNGKTSGIAAISGITGSVTVKGDDSFTVNDAVTIGSGNGASINFVLDADNNVTVKGAEGKNYSVTGGSVLYEVAVTNKATAATLGGAAVSFKSTANETLEAYGAGEDAIVSIKGAKLGDEIKVDNDAKFIVEYAINTVKAGNSETTGVITINDTKVTIDGANIAEDVSKLTVTYDKSAGDTPKITIDELGGTGIVEVTTGEYVINPNNNNGQIYERRGYIVLDSASGAQFYDESVYDQTAGRQKALEDAQNVASTLEAYQLFYDLNNASIISSPTVQSSSIAGFAAQATVPVATAQSGKGVVNVYADAPFGSATEITAVTLQSFNSEPIHVDVTKGKNPGAGNVIQSAVIDASGSNGPTFINLGHDSLDVANDSLNAVNYIVYGSHKASTILVGKNAAGNNEIHAGSGNDYLYHVDSGANAGVLLEGGAGNDTIVPGSENDTVFGGAGADVFFDSNDISPSAYTIQDYSFEDGDRLIGTHLSKGMFSSAEDLIANIKVDNNAIELAGGPKIQIGADVEETLGTLVRIADALGDSVNLAWAGGNDDNVVSVSAAGSKGAVVLATVSGVSYNDSIIGSSGADTIFAGGGDTVRSGAGNDTIYVTSTDGDDALGAVIEAAAGTNVVSGWTFGFDNTAGANILYLGPSYAGNFTYNRTSKELTASVSSGGTSIGTLRFDGADSTQSGVADSTAKNGYQVLFTTSNADNAKKAYVLRDSELSEVLTDDGLADYYFGGSTGKSTLRFGNDVTEIGTATLSNGFEYNISLGSDAYRNIHNLNVSNDGYATILGSDDEGAVDRVTIGGSADDHHRKAISLAGGNDMLWSNSDSTQSGADIHFGYNEDGRDTVYGFTYWDSEDFYNDGADILHLYNWTDEGSINGVRTSANRDSHSIVDRLEIVLGDGRSIAIANHSVDSVVHYNIDGSDEYNNIKMGATTGNNTNVFTYDSNVVTYYGNGQYNRDTLQAAGETENWNISLGDKSVDSVNYVGIGVVDGRNVENYAVISGNASNNVIYGGKGYSTLWGGGAGNDTLIGGSGNDVFRFGKTIADNNNVVINGANAESDYVDLYGVSISDLASANFDGATATIALTDGSKLTVNDANDVKFHIGDEIFVATLTDSEPNGFKKYEEA